MLHERMRAAKSTANRPTHEKREAPRKRHLPTPYAPLPYPLSFYFFTLNR